MLGAARRTWMDEGRLEVPPAQLGSLAEITMELTGRLPAGLAVVLVELGSKKRLSFG